MDLGAELAVPEERDAGQVGADALDEFVSGVLGRVGAIAGFVKVGMLEHMLQHGGRAVEGCREERVEIAVVVVVSGFNCAVGAVVLQYLVAQSG